MRLLSPVVIADAAATRCLHYSVPDALAALLCVPIGIALCLRALPAGDGA